MVLFNHTNSIILPCCHQNTLFPLVEEGCDCSQGNQCNCFWLVALTGREISAGTRWVGWAVGGKKEEYGSFWREMVGGRMEEKEVGLAAFTCQCILSISLSDIILILTSAPAK